MNVPLSVRLAVSLGMLPGRGRRQFPTLEAATRAPAGPPLGPPLGRAPPGHRLGQLMTQKIGQECGRTVSESSMGEEDSALLATSPAAGETETNEEQAGSSMNGTELAGSMWAVATDFGVTFPGQRRFPHLPMHE